MTRIALLTAASAFALAGCNAPSETETPAPSAAAAYPAPSASADARAMAPRGEKTRGAAACKIQAVARARHARASLRAARVEQEEALRLQVLKGVATLPEASIARMLSLLSRRSPSGIPLTSTLSCGDS